MSSKIALLISMVFFAFFFMLGVDLMTIQFCYSDLDSKSVGITYEISRNGRSDDEYISSLEEKYKVQISDISNENPEFGDMVEYVIGVTYQPIIISRDVMNIRMKRSAVIGYY